MKFDFDNTPDRRNSGSLKWNVGKDEIPLWVADMDFSAAPAIVNALKNRTEHGVFGYNEVTEDWYDAFVGWWKRRHNVNIPKESLVFCTGVVPTISSAVRRFTAPNEKVLVLTPVYNIFFNSILNNGRRAVSLPLEYEKGGYRLNIEQLEEKLADKETTLFILCNPHNPIGKIWSKEELFIIGKLCKKYSVTVISDEIHCDITQPDKKYQPFAFVSDDCAECSITCISATKAFNLAGLQCSAIFSLNDKLLARINRAINTDEVAEPNSFAVAATVAAFDKSEEWLDEMRQYTFKNKQFVADYCNNYIKELTVNLSEATYLCWVDCSSVVGVGKPFSSTRELCEDIRKKTGVYLSEGGQFGLGGENFFRLNAACPRLLLSNALDRLKGYFDLLRSR